ncbi:MAG: shikimate kinase [Bacteroidota bacterium]|nr:shikimate kinase [Bacteroidota bacterium]
MIVYLIGFMGSGKSTFGKRMASRAGWKFEDLDSLIENIEGRPVRNIFTESGEDYFREIEAGILRDVPRHENIVVACGGGTPCYKDNMEFMNRSGVTVYLKHNVQTLAHRLKNAKKIRPLLEGMNPSEMGKYISTKLAEREEWYNKSQLIIDGLKADPGNLMDIILSHPHNHEDNA